MKFNFIERFKDNKDRERDLRNLSASKNQQEKGSGRPRIDELDLIPIDEKEEQGFVEGTGYIPLDQLADPSHDWERYGESDHEELEDDYDYYTEQLRQQEHEWDQMVAGAIDQENLGQLITEKMLEESKKDITPRTKTRNQVNRNKTQEREYYKDQNRRHLWNDFYKYTEKFHPEFYDKTKRSLRGKDYDNAWKSSQTSKTWTENLFKEYLSWRKQNIDPKKIKEVVENQHKNYHLYQDIDDEKAA